MTTNRSNTPRERMIMSGANDTSTTSNLDDLSEEAKARLIREFYARYNRSGMTLRERVARVWHKFGRK